MTNFLVLQRPTFEKTKVDFLVKNQFNCMYLISKSSVLKVSKFQKQIFLFSFEPKTERNCFLFLFFKTCLLVGLVSCDTLALSNTLFSHFFSEELRLQRNIDNYSLLRPSSNKSSSKGNSPKDAGKSQSSKDGDATFIDRTEFLITKVSIFIWSGL